MDTSRGTTRIGAAWRPIEIDRPVPMSGFGARTEPSTGTADVPPRASAVAFDGDVLVVVDAIGVDPPLVAAVAEAAGDLGGATLHVAATHTHAGPCVLADRLGPYAPEAAAALASAAGDAARAALAASEPCALEWLRPVVPGVAHNRRRGEASPDAPLKGLRWRAASGQVRGTLLSYPCHPTSLGPLNRQLSGDYPGFVRVAVEESAGGVCVFATGCAGDINTGHSATASFSVASDAGRTMADSRGVGVRLAAAALDGDWTPLPAGGARSARADVRLEQRPLDDEPLAQQRARWEAALCDADAGERAVLDAWIDWSRRPEANRPATWRGEVRALRVGDVALVLLPGEPFLDAARWLDDRLGGRVIALGYAGDCPGYLPSAAEYSLGGYEVLDAHRYYGAPAPFARGSLEALVDAAVALAGGLR